MQTLIRTSEPTCKNTGFTQLDATCGACTGKEGCNRGHGLSAAIKLGTPEPPKFLQSGRKLTCS